jgi:hypothetical protein
MKVSTLILSVILGTTAASAFAAPAAAPSAGKEMSWSQPHSWYQASKFEQQAEAQKRTLEQQGFPQYDG